MTLNNNAECFETQKKSPKRFHPPWRCGPAREAATNGNPIQSAADVTILTGNFA